MIQDKIFFDEKDPTGLSYNTPFTVYGSYEGRLWSKTPSGEIKYYTQNSDLSVYATTGSNQFEGAQDVTGSLTVTGSFNLNDSATNFNILGNQFGETYLISNNGNIVLHPIGDSEGIVIIKETDLSVEGDITVNNLYASNGVVSGSSQIVEYNVFATTGSNQFDGNQAITGSLTVTGQVIAQTLNVQEVTSSIVFSSGSNRFGNNSGNTHRFTGSLAVTGSLTVNGAGTFASSITSDDLILTAGTLFGTGNTGFSNRLSDTTLYLQMPATGFNITDNALNTRFILTSAGAATFLSTNLTLQSSTEAEVRSLTTSTGNYANFIVDTNNVVDYRLQMVGFGTTASGTLAGISRAGNGFVVKSGGLLAIGTRDSNDLVLSTNETERMRITSGGNTEVRSGNILNIYRTDNTRALQLSTTSNECLIDAWAASSEPLMLRSNGAGGRIVFHTNGGERVRITSDGEVNIGGFGTIFPVLTVKGIASSPHIGSTWSVSANQDGTGRTIIGTAGQGRSMYFENNGDIVIPNNSLQVGGPLNINGSYIRGKTITGTANSTDVILGVFLGYPGGISGTVEVFAMAGIVAGGSISSRILTFNFSGGNLAGGSASAANVSNSVLGAVAAPSPAGTSIDSLSASITSLTVDSFNISISNSISGTQITAPTYYIQVTYGLHANASIS
jgi:hypothetical protein